jgi:hypothetical protein
LTDEALLKCAFAAFDIVAPDYEPTMGKPTPKERDKICRALARDMRKGVAIVPEVSAAPQEQQLRVAVHAGTKLIRKLIDDTLAKDGES